MFFFVLVLLLLPCLIVVCWLDVVLCVCVVFGGLILGDFCYLSVWRSFFFSFLFSSCFAFFFVLFFFFFCIFLKMLAAWSPSALQLNKN